MMLNDVHRGIKKRKKRRRIGRGPGSGFGKTSGRGHKGAQSRSGYSRKPVFQGGAMPLVRRVPKRGFNNRFATPVETLNVSDLQHCFEDGQEVGLEQLRSKSLVVARDNAQVKVLGDGELTKKLTVAAHRFSKSAREKIEKAGGQVQVLPGPTPVEEKKKKQRAGGSPSSASKAKNPTPPPAEEPSQDA